MMSSSASLHSTENNKVLLTYGALLKCSSLLVTLGGAVAEGNQEEGMELVWNNTPLFGQIDLKNTIIYLFE